MSPTQLRTLRAQRTRAEYAAQLGCSASAIVQWEGGTRPIPTWVEEKALRGANVSLPVDEMRDIIELAQSSGSSFEAILGDALRAHLAAHRLDKAATGETSTSTGSHEEAAQLNESPTPFSRR